MKRLALVGALLVVLSACHDPDAAAPASHVSTVDSATASPSPSRSPSAVSSTLGPTPIRLRVVATVPVADGEVRGLAICGDHLARVVGESALVLTDWRTGGSRTLLTAPDSQLYFGRQSGCRVEVFDTVDGYNGENPDETGRTVSVDLRTGQTHTIHRSPYPPHYVGAVPGVGEVYSVEGEGPSGAYWSTLLLVTPQDVTPLSSTGVVSEPVLANHLVAWADGHRPAENSEPDEVRVLDLTSPGPPLTLEQGAGTPYGLGIGDGFVVWARDGVRPVLAAATGGPVTRLPGSIPTPGGWPATHRRLVAYADTQAGHRVIRVVRVG